jgi:proline iminopeptidase
VLFDSEASLRDLRDYARGLTSSDNHFRPQIRGVDLLSLGTDFDLPFFVFQGARDNVTPIQPVKNYLEHVTAPHKELVLIADAGHDAIATKSHEFLTLLLERVRPLAIRTIAGKPPARPTAS